MPSLMSVIVIGLVLGVLALMPSIRLGDTLEAWLSAPSSFGWLSFDLVFIVLMTVWVQRCRCISKALIICACGLVIGLLFVLRSMMAYVQFEQHTISQSHTVTAITDVSEISDSIYDPVSESAYRQKVTITDIRPTNRPQATNATISANPFGEISESVASDAIELPNSMNVLLSSSPRRDQNNPALAQLNNLIPNTSAKLTLLIEPISTQKSASGFDSNVWLRTRDIHATARVLSVDQIESADDYRISTRLQGLRQRLRAHFYEDWHDYDIFNQQARAVTLSLLTGDRSLISRQTKDLYQLAGISHLLAISGMHVLFLALILAGLTSWLLDKFPKVYGAVSRKQIRLIIMVAASLIYATFTGFDVPAVRTVYMLGAVALARYFVLPVSNLSLLFIVALIMTWLDPYVLWQAGFWLSFVAVLLLMRYESTPIQEVTTATRIWQKAKSATALQLWLFIGMLPVSILFFGKVSLWGVLVNLFAIGLFGSIILPINLLAGVIYAISPSLADGLWSLSSWILLKLHTALEFGLVGDSWLYVPFGMLGLVLAVLAILPMLSKALPKSAAIIPLSVLLMLLMNGHFYTPKDAKPTAKVIKTDNQALQVVLIQHQSHSWLLLADFGIKSLPDGQIDVLIDELKRLGVRNLTGVVAQNSGQALTKLTAAIHARLPIERYWRAGQGVLKLANVIDEPCQAGQIHQYDGVSIRMLTGWQQINDVAVWDCAIEISSELGFNIDQPMEAESDELLPSDIKQIIVNAATHEDVWHLWRLLCVDMDIMPRPEAGASLWLSHAFAKDDADVMVDFEATLWRAR